MNPLIQLQQQGQSVWLDYIRRGLIRSGDLQRMVEQDGLRGMTSNPTIFMKAITGSDEYDPQLKDLLANDPETTVEQLYESLVIDDIRAAADVLRPVYDQADGQDGFVSLEVSPHLAYKTSESIEEARRLWKSVDRPNLLIKIPATDEGIPAIETLLSEGINVNITLMFSLDHYEAVAQAYLRALQKVRDPGGIASVASFFISRITHAVDQALDASGADAAQELKGKIGIANAKQTYQRFQEILAGDAFQELQRRGARIQRVLWASTGTKDPDYSDVLYVENLIGRHTVNTMKPETLEAFRDHGEVRGQTILEDVEEAKAQIQQLAQFGINLDEITQQLQRDGVTKFSDPFDQLFEALDKKRRNILSHTGGRQKAVSRNR